MSATLSPAEEMETLLGALNTAECIVERIRRRVREIKKCALPEPESGVDVPAGTVLASRRRALDLSQETVAARALISRGLLSDIETGRRTNPQSRLAVHRTLQAALTHRSEASSRSIL